MLASLISRTAALSTIFLTVKRLIALSFGTQREQLEQRMKVTWPRPFLLRPPFLLFFVYWTWNKNRVSVDASKKNRIKTEKACPHPNSLKCIQPISPTISPNYGHESIWDTPSRDLTLKKGLTMLSVERCVERRWMCCGQCAATAFPHGRVPGRSFRHSAELGQEQWQWQSWQAGRRQPLFVPGIKIHDVYKVRFTFFFFFPSLHFLTSFFSFRARRSLIIGLTFIDHAFLSILHLLSLSFNHIRSLCPDGIARSRNSAQQCPRGPAA